MPSDPLIQQRPGERGDGQGRQKEYGRRLVELQKLKRKKINHRRREKTHAAQKPRARRGEGGDRPYTV